MASKSRDKSKLSKNEVAANFVRDWVEFENPANPEEIFKCDLTWLTSYWQCIYGNGCCGIDADKPDAGCCSDGAYYTGKEDEKRVFEAAKKLTRADWQFYEVVQTVCKLFSIDPSIQDTDFLYNIILLNETLVEEDSLTSKLKRPTLRNYEYDWVVQMKSIVNEYYRNTISLYSAKDDVNDLLYALKSEGTLDIFDGDLYEEDTKDSEMLDDELDSVTEI